jgi:hypothetical protein
MSVDKLRVAVVFSGRATCYEESYEWFTKLSGKYAVDFYCSISTELDEYYKGLLDLYKIKKYTFGDMQAQREYQSINIRNRISMFYNLKLGVDMIPLHHYDVVLYARTDLVYTGELDLAMAVRNNNTNVVFIPEGWDWHGVNDKMAFGTPTAMFKYSRVYDNIDSYLHSCYIPGDIHPETTLKFHLDIVGLEIQRFELGHELNPNRHDYEINKAKAN